MFSVYYWPVTLLFAVIAASVAGGLAATNRNEGAGGKIGGAVVVSFIVALIFERVLFYYGQPELIGTFFGYSWPLFWALVPGIVIGCAFAEASGAAIGIGAMVFLAFFGWKGIVYAEYNIGYDNFKAFSNLPKIEISHDKHIPPTDPRHMVLVTPQMAQLKASTALTSVPGKNYNMRYHVGDPVLKVIKGHRWYNVPMVPYQSTDTTWNWTGRTVSPGYILVDAENDVPAEVHDTNPKTGKPYSIDLYVDGSWNMDVARFAYLAGYTDGIIDHPKFEVDDDMQPHYVMTYLTPAFGDTYGWQPSKVLVVSFSDAGPTIEAYKPGDPKIAWVNRVISLNLLKDWVSDWGYYGHGNESIFSTAMGLNTQFSFVPANDNPYMLSYTKDGHSVWVIPMTSTTSKDQSVIGVLVFDTEENKGTFYQDIRGFNHADSAISTMRAADGNKKIGGGYPIENVELYEIYGHLTWVAIYVNPQANGSTAAAYGLMDAFNQSPNKVAFGETIDDALQQYLDILTRTGNNIGLSQQGNFTPFQGKIWRIDPTGSGAWEFKLVGDPRFFIADKTAFIGMPIVRDGDTISGDLFNTGTEPAQVHTLHILNMPTDLAKPLDAPKLPANPADAK